LIFLLSLEFCGAPLKNPIDLALSEVGLEPSKDSFKSFKISKLKFFIKCILRMLQQKFQPKVSLKYRPRLAKIYTKAFRSPLKIKKILFIETYILRPNKLDPATKKAIARFSLLLGDTDSLASATSGLGVLTADTDTPVVAETTVSADLLQAFQILTELVVQEVGHDLSSLA